MLRDGANGSGVGFDGFWLGGGAGGSLASPVVQFAGGMSGLR